MLSKLWKASAVSFVCCASAFAQTGPPLNFKGLAMGAAVADLRAVYPHLTCKRVPPSFVSLGEETCRDDISCHTDQCRASRLLLDTYGGAPAIDLLFNVVAGQVVGFNVTTAQGKYESIREALRIVYGQGLETTDMLVRSNGSRLPGRSWSTNAVGGVIHLMEFAGRTDQASVTAVSDQFAKWKEASRRGDPNKNKSDL